MTRRFVEALLQMGDRNLFLGGMMSWTGFRQIGLPVIKKQRGGIDAHCTPDEYDMFAALGYARLNKAKAKKCLEARSRGYHLASYVSSRSVSSPDVSISENCFIMEGI